MGLALDGYAESLVQHVPGVEINIFLGRGSVDLLGDIDDGNAGVRLWHFKCRERRMWELVLEVHLRGEAIDGGMDGVAAGNSGVDGDGNSVGARVGHADPLDGQYGIVDLLLDHFRDGDEEALIIVSLRCIACESGSGATYIGSKTTRRTMARTINSAHHHFFINPTHPPLLDFPATCTVSTWPSPEPVLERLILVDLIDEMSVSRKRKVHTGGGRHEVRGEGVDEDMNSVWSRNVQRDEFKKV